MALAERVGSAIGGLGTRRRIDFPALLKETFSTHENEGRRMQLRGRTFSLLAIFILVAFVAPFPDFLYYQALVLFFITTGFVPALMDRLGRLRPWHLYFFIALDFALMTFALIYPNPLAPPDLPPQLTLRFDTSLYLFIMLAGLAFSDHPRMVIWGGVVGAVSWTIGVGWLASLPDSIVVWPGGGGALIDDAGIRMRLISSPTFVDLGVLIQTVVIFLLVAIILAAGVARARRLVWRYAAIERQRLNLARYFAPSTVEHLANQDEPLGQIREMRTATMFADLVGFTRWSERHTPAQAIGLLREVHTLLEEAVFRYGGTLDKFIGDGIMATFGTPEPSPRDAANAVACVKAILADVARFNETRRARGLDAVQVAVGLHFGAVVVGNIGTERRLEFGVIGDSVNVASRLEELTRAIGRRAVISDDVVAQVRDQAPAEIDFLLEGFDFLGDNHLEGRRQHIAIWASRETLDASESRAPKGRRE